MPACAGGAAVRCCKGCRWPNPRAEKSACACEAPGDVASPVSYLARDRGPAKSLARLACARCPSFNPRPSLLTGESHRFQPVVFLVEFVHAARTSARKRGGHGCPPGAFRNFHKKQWVAMSANLQGQPCGALGSRFDLKRSGRAECPYKTSGPSKSTALKCPCSLTSAPLVSGRR